MSSLPLPPLIPNLPDDIASRCIAFLPLSAHPTLSLVSRSWRSLFSSPLLFKLRPSLLPLEPFLFISIRTPFKPPPSLYFFLYPSLPRNPQPVPSPPIAVAGSVCCALGPTLYVLGGSEDDIPSRAVQIFDLCTHRWSRGPSMIAAREFAAAGSIDGRIYVIGGCLPSTSSWATLASLGGLLCLMWEGRKMTVKSSGVEITRLRNVVGISCAGIEISRMKDGGLKGTVMWLENDVLVVPRGSTIAHCIPVEL